MNSAQAKKTSLYDLLSKLGYSPIETRKSGNEIWYRSPFRQETEPSFKIRLDQNVWYDFGIGAGGNVLDFVMRFKQCSFQEALYFLGNTPIKNSISSLPASKEEPQATLDIFSTKSPLILSNKPLYHYALKNYLQERCIDLETGYKYLKEIHYQVEGKTYFALGFKNESEGWEVRNSLFKGCLGKKDITLILNGFKKISVFEGFFDFLSFCTTHGNEALCTDILVLNSVALKKKGLSVVKGGNYSQIDSYLDNDTTGQETLNYFQTELPGMVVQSMSQSFAPYKDYNAFHMATSNAEI